jgi:release factor glutamine methyltransferase
VPSLRQAFESGADQLTRSPHAERARLDAETLLIHVIGKNKAWLLAHSEEQLSQSDAARYNALIERRLRGEPIQYIAGETEFYGLPFRVTPDVLIPRPETEHLVERVLALAASFPHPRIVDIGTGSGAIAVALAHHLPYAAITAIDLSDRALALAQENAALNHVDTRIRFLRGDLLSPVASENFDLVVSNPPYVAEADRASLSVEVRDHEPVLALFAGADGLAVYQRLIPAAHAALAPGGFIAVEIGVGQSSAVALLLTAASFGEIESTPDLQGIPRVLTARRA